MEKKGLRLFDFQRGAKEQLYKHHTVFQIKQGEKRLRTNDKNRKK